MYPMMSKQEVFSFIPEIVKENVSIRARKPDGFLSMFMKDRLDQRYPNKQHNYLTERELFINRHLAQYKKNPTKRRRLALIAWAFKPVE